MKPDRDLRQYALYATATGLMIYLGITLINHVGVLWPLLAAALGTLEQLLTPLLGALIIVYLLRPGVQAVETFLARRPLVKSPGARRTVGIVVVYLAVIAVFVGLVYGIYAMIGGKLSNNATLTDMITDLAEYQKKSILSVNAITEKLQSLNIPIGANLNEKIAELVSSVQRYFAYILEHTAGFVISLGGNLFTFVLAAVLSIYLIKDAEYFADLWHKLFGLLFGRNAAGAKVAEVLAIVDDTFRRYIRGQLLEAAIVGLLSAVVLYLIGIDYAIMIGVISGICNMIPYIGPIAGTVLAVLIALLSGQPLLALWATVGMILVQQIDNNLLAPKIVGDSVGLHPVFTMLAIVIGGNVGGLFGMLTAVPVAASVKILLNRWYESHQEKSAG
ncbi:MAG: AI-2E family transporter [Veillonellaceae bacterium]|nr:AI-2E family transporter [Veillonellaceae bacterium]